jgi:hypothetical protein
MKRYTRAMLDEALVKINEEISSTGFYLCAQSRNGYTGLDEYKGSSVDGNAGRCIRNIECGTPRQCIEAANVYVQKS